MQPPAFVLVPLSILKKVGNAPSSELTRREFFILAKQEFFGIAEGIVGSDDKVDMAVRKPSKFASHSMRLTTLEFFKRLHGLFWKNVLYALENGKPSERSASKHFRFTAPVLPPVLAAFEDQSSHFLQIKRPTWSRAMVVELNDEKDDVGGEASSGVRLCLEKSPFLLYGEDEPPVKNVKEAGSEKKKLSSSIRLIGNRREKRRRAVEAARKTEYGSEN